MDSNQTAPAMKPRIRNDFKTQHLGKPPPKAVNVSAAAVFKKHGLDTPQLQSTTRSPQRLNVRKKKQKSQVDEAHPLVLAFKGTSEEYRRHLYVNAVTGIKKELNVLLNKLHESDIQIASSDPASNGSQASPLKITVPIKYQRLVQKLCDPLANHRYTLQQTSTSGRVEKVHYTLHERFQLFEEDIRVQTEEVKNLQRQWESVVAEIFQVGVACLGEDKLAAMLSSAGPDMHGENSTLFVSEHGSLASNGRGKRKRVSFAGPGMASLFPGFLLQTSEQQKLVSATPDPPADAAQSIEEAISDLGKQHVLNFQRLEKEHQAWWKKKQHQLAHTFMED